jgi:hypothetical protein
MKNKLSLSDHNLLRVEKNYQMLTGDSNVVNNISLEQCDELILTLNRSEEKLLQRRVSYDIILVIDLQLSSSICIVSINHHIYLFLFIPHINVLSFTIFIM